MDVTQAVDRLVERIGRDRFDEACTWAWRTAAETGLPGALAWPDAVAHVPHEVTDLAFPGPRDLLPEADDLTRQAVVLLCYRRMPCSALLVTLPAVRTPTVLAAYWDQVRALLDEEDDRFAAPVAHHLWAGDFQAGSPVVDQAWAEVTRGIGRSRHRLRRVVDASGPVPWATKRELFSRLAADPMLKDLALAAVCVARSHRGSGIDEVEARRWGL